MRLSVVFFDLDGTLADSMPRLIEHIVAMMQRDHGVDEAEMRRRLPDLLAMPAHQMFAATMAMAGIDLQALPPEEAAALIDRYLDIGTQIPIEPFDEVAEVLDRLQQSGRTLFITTNASQSGLAERLMEAGLQHHFRRVFGTSNGVFKGAAHIRMAAEELGITVEELAPQSVLVGDTEADMKMAREAGMVAIGRLTGDNGARLRAAGADYLIRDLRELEALLESL